MITTSSGRKYYTQDEFDKLSEEIKLWKKETDFLVEELREAAIRYDLCNTYDEWVDETNQSLTLFRLLNATKEFEVTVKVTRTEVQDVTVTVRATDCYGAEHTVNEMDDREIRNEINSWNWEEEDFEYEVLCVDEA